VYFGSIPAGDLVAEDRLVRWSMRREGEHKIGVLPGAVTGRAGCAASAGRLR